MSNYRKASVACRQMARYCKLLMLCYYKELLPCQRKDGTIYIQEKHMTTPESIMIDDVKYVREDQTTADLKGDVKIIVADRGFVYVGHCEETIDFVKLTGAKNIRSWGTTKGLGELVNGPLGATKLDSVGSIRIPNRAVISIIDVNQSKWKLL